MTELEFEYLRNFLKQRSGLALTAEKRYLAESRLTPVCRRFGIASLGDLIGSLKLAQNGAIERAVVEAMTTNESFFFRDDKPFDHFKNHALPRILAARPPGSTIRIWSAASSSGQEAYSLAMILLEHERELARRGQLAGVVYFGNPNTAPGDWSTVGVPKGGAGGMLGFLPFNTKTAAATRNRVNYCLPLDAVCDLSVQTLQASQATGGNHARYFRWWSQWDNQVADSFGRFVDQVRYR